MIGNKGTVWPPVRVWLPHGPVHLAAVSPELRNNDGAWWLREDMVLTTLQSKRDKWNELAADQPGWKQHVRAADELIALLIAICRDDTGAEREG